jgi:hypothetical protein
MRHNVVINRVGAPRTGKTTHVLKLIEESATARGVLIFDVNNEEKYQRFPLMPLDKLQHWKKTGIYRLFSDDDQAIIQALYKWAYNCLIVFEDATAYIRPNVQDEIRKLLVSRRHRGLDMLFTFHSLNRVPPLLYEMTNYIVLGKTNDPLDQSSSISKVPNFATVRAAWDRVQAHPSPYYFEQIAIQA